MGLYYSTSGRRLLLDNWSGDTVQFAALSPKGDGAVVLAGDQLLDRSIDNPHPEISFRTLFLPVWYEGYAAPKWVWQTTGGTDAFEPKMSLWPLIFGTLKATLYALLFSVPIALMAAVYVSQLAPAWLQSIVKPTIELMAAVPSVVVGFIAALWLAPRLEAALFAALVTLICLPLSVFVALLAWRVLPVTFRRSAGAGSELVALLVGLFSVLILVAVFADPIESWLFGGDFQRYLFTEWGLRFDQRNSIIVGLALGFAVIPVIFTIAEDACSAVPGSLVSASRALGATRWQTAVKLVVPAASPGLFAGVMLGLGRAVGETMIVLMAAGNTPILDLSPFNGMRTMSAAIAVEIPEAPVGGTLFRVLFLTGALLFVFTLVVTTAADVVGAISGKNMPGSESTKPALVINRKGLAPGLPGIWSTALATLLVLVMLALLLWVVAVNAFGWFWPAAVWQAETLDGREIIGAEVGRELVPGPDGAEEVFRLQFKIGNRDLDGRDFVWLDEADIRSKARPEDLVRIVRSEYGDAFGRIIGATTPAVSRSARRIRLRWPSFSNLVPKVAPRRAGWKRN